MIHKFRYILAAGALSAAFSAGAVRALPKPQTVTQPDGTTLTIVKAGDESMHFTLTTDGMLVTADADGQYSYARIDRSGNVVSTGIRAVDPAMRPRSHRYLMQNVKDIDINTVVKARAGRPRHSLNGVNLENAARNRKRAASPDSSLPQSGMGLFSGSFPSRGKIKGLVILVEFQDVKFNTGYDAGAQSYFNDLLHKEGFSEYGGTGCVTEYFRAQSNGVFDPEFDLYGPVTLPQPMAYYGGNNASGDDLRPHMMVVHACQALDAQVDFSKYDNDGDGYADNVFIFYAGQGEASYGSDDSVWPHSWNVSAGTGTDFVLDNVKIDRYACSNEWGQNRPDGVGTFIHEFSHVMGLPDLYNTVNQFVGYTPNEWSVMDLGSYNNNGCTPPNYGIYERNALGWIDPELLDGTPRFATLNHIGGFNEGFIIQTEREREFFLLENRQNEGWDRYLPGHGMLVWHIDFAQRIFDNNEVNNTESHQYVDLVEANDSPSGTALDGYSWPGTRNKTAFDATTVPALLSWAGQPTAVAVSGITETDGVIRFRVNGGFTRLVANDVTDYGPDWFTASWQPADGAESYELTVMATNGTGGESATETAGMDERLLPQGWTTDATNFSTVSGVYGEASPSLMLRADGQNLETRAFEGNVSGLSFWCRSYGPGTGAQLAVEALVPAATAKSPLQHVAAAGGKWVTVETIAPNNTAQTYTFGADKIPASTRAFRLVMKKNGTAPGPNIAIDDVKVDYTGGVSQIVAGYDALNVGNVTGYTVRDLPAADSYSYTVTAVSGSGKSEPSLPVTVFAGSQSGVDDIAADLENSDIVTVNGLTVSVFTSAERVEAYDTTGRHIATVRPTAGNALLHMPRTGLYIVKARDSHKVVVK